MSSGADRDSFFAYMQELLGDEFSDFKAAYDGKPRHKALRVNTRKIKADEFCAISGFELTQNPLCENSFYCGVKPSLDPLYHAGLYYMQEPSASAAVSAFAPFISERVLDLCAAPGGKSTQAAEYMRGGVLFCNDIEYKRVRVLAENIERLGISNAVVTCNSARQYRDAGFDGFFDTLIIDAPCSGGGMMRYEDVKYSREIVLGCAARQREILRDATELLAPGGHMLYSTCTFAKEENEDNVEYLRTLGMEAVDIPLRPGETRGIGIDAARRVYPHKFDGEGHFYCVLEKTSGTAAGRPPLRKKLRKVKIGGLDIDCFDVRGQKTLDFDCPDISGLNAVCVGTKVYDDEKREVPSYALAHALTSEQVRRLGCVEVPTEYLRGAQLELEAQHGYVVATTHGYAIGMARAARSGDGATVLKNLYPKNFRIV